MAYPPFDSGDSKLLRCQRRIEVTAKCAAQVCPLQPRRHSVGGLFVSVAAFLWEPPRPEGRVDLHNGRLALRDVPAVERPEVNRAFALAPEVEEPRQTGERRFGNRPLNVEQENRFRGGRPPFGQPEPTGVTHPFRALPDIAVSDEVDIGAGFVGRPVSPEVNQEGRPVAGEPVPFEIGQREREGVVNADQSRDVPVEFLMEPLSKTPPRPVTAWARRRLNLHRRAGAFSNIDPEPLATGVCGLRAGIVDTDVALELSQQ